MIAFTNSPHQAANDEISINAEHFPRKIKRWGTEHCECSDINFTTLLKD